MIAVKLPTELFDKTNRFCVAVNKERTARNIRNNDNRQGRLVDETIGKLGEVGVAYHFKKLHLIDWNIYPDGKPTFAPDLGIVHVKTCKMSYRNGQYDSWTIDRKDPLRIKPNNKDDILLTYSELNGYVYLYGRILAVMAFPHWKDCKEDHMKHKQAIYKSDVDDIVEKFN